jgi:hypothetical protein
LLFGRCLRCCRFLVECVERKRVFIVGGHRRLGSFIGRGVFLRSLGVIIVVCGWFERRFIRGGFFVIIFVRGRFERSLVFGRFFEARGILIVVVVARIDGSLVDRLFWRRLVVFFFLRSCFIGNWFFHRRLVLIILVGGWFKRRFIGGGVFRRWLIVILVCRRFKRSFSGGVSFGAKRIVIAVVVRRLETSLIANWFCWRRGFVKLLL